MKFAYDVESGIIGWMYWGDNASAGEYYEQSSDMKVTEKQISSEEIENKKNQVNVEDGEKAVLVYDASSGEITAKAIYIETK